MARVSIPEPDAFLTAIARRIETLEQDGARTSTDLTALGRGVADLTAQIRHLANQPGDDATDPAGLAAEEGQGQPDWLAVTDPQAARELLEAVQAWTEQVLGRFGWRLPAQCWPLHPLVVV